MQLFASARLRRAVMKHKHGQLVEVIGVVQHLLQFRVVVNTD